MACFGSKAIRRKETKHNALLDSGLEDGSPKKKGKKDKGQKHKKGGFSMGKAPSIEKHEKKSKDRKKGKGHGKDHRSESAKKINPAHMKNQNSSVLSKASKPVTNVLRKRVDPETAKYFLEIANLFENKEIDLEERSTICANALEETKGKEIELATDGVISHTLQILVEGCELEQLCVFLCNCVESFPVIAMDKFGSHVAEAALKSLATHIEDENSRAIVEEILDKICKAIAADASHVMCSCYGSHVLRTLLCLCKGVPLYSLQDFHTTKRSAVLAERLSSGLHQLGRHDLKNFKHGFTEMFKHFVRQLLTCAKDEISTLRVEKNSSLVLQTLLKLSVGDDQELRHIIAILLDCNDDDTPQENIYVGQKNELIGLLEDTAASHLLEVIAEVAPEDLRNDMLTGTFRGTLFAISSHHCGNYMVQALISSARTSDQIEQIWEELGSKITALLELGKTGVVASILAACQRLETNRLESSQALAAALGLDSESPDCIIAHILFLENFLREKSSWEWPLDKKMSVLGCLMLQTIFQYPHQYIRPYVASLLSMNDDQILQISKDSGGSRVLEVFLCSSATAKRKFKVFAKLQGHYGEIAMNPSGSFLVEKCFTASNFSHKEAIVAELAAVRAKLSKTKHGIHLLKKLDVYDYASRPEQWKALQTSKEAAHREFQVEFGLYSIPTARNTKEHSSKSDAKKCKQNDKSDNVTRDDGNNKPDLFQQDTKRLQSAKATSHKESHSKELVSDRTSVPFLNSSKRKSPGVLIDKRSLKKQKFQRPDTGKSDSKKFVRDNISTAFVRNTGKQKLSVTELADLAGKKTLSAGEVRKLFKPEMFFHARVEVAIWFVIVSEGTELLLSVLAH